MKKTSKNIIVTRHHGLVEWLKSRGISGDVLTHVADESQIRGKIVYGVLPLSLAAKCEIYVAVDMPNIRPYQRGADLSPREMDAAGAKMTRYRVEAL